MTAPGTWGTTFPFRLSVTLGLVLGIHLALGAISTLGLIARGEPPFKAFGATAPSYAPRFLLNSLSDSWDPLMRAHKVETEGAEENYYAAVALQGKKFQYPPSSLLVMDLIPDSYQELSQVKRGAPLNLVLSWLGRLAFLLTVGASVTILWLGLGNNSKPKSSAEWRELGKVALFSTLLALTNYPVAAAYVFGQVQVFLNCLIAAALLLYLVNRKFLSGVCIAICCAFKPQYGVILLWALFRRDWKMAGGFGLTALIIGVVSLIRFGIADHLLYLELLRDIAKRGETYWMNQSVNGIANFLVGNGNQEEFSNWDYAPYHPVVHIATTLTSLGILIVALWPSRVTRQADVLSLSLALLASTMASPIAWEHHYGATFPIFAVAVAVAIRQGARPIMFFMLGLSYLCMSFTLQKPELFFHHILIGSLGYHLFFGAIILFVILWGLQIDRKSGTGR